MILLIMIRLTAYDLKCQQAIYMEANASKCKLYIDVDLACWASMS